MGNDGKIMERIIFILMLVAMISFGVCRFGYPDTVSQGGFSQSLALSFFFYFGKIDLHG